MDFFENWVEPEPLLNSSDPATNEQNARYKSVTFVVDDIKSEPGIRISIIPNSSSNLRRSLDEPARKKIKSGESNLEDTQLLDDIKTEKIIQVNLIP